MTVLETHDDVAQDRDLVVSRWLIITTAQIIPAEQFFYLFMRELTHSITNFNFPKSHFSAIGDGECRREEIRLEQCFHGFRVAPRSTLAPTVFWRRIASSWASSGQSTAKEMKILRKPFIPRRHQKQKRGLPCDGWERQSDDCALGPGSGQWTCGIESPYVPNILRMLHNLWATDGIAWQDKAKIPWDSFGDQLCGDANDETLQ